MGGFRFRRVRIALAFVVLVAMFGMVNAPNAYARPDKATAPAIQRLWPANGSSTGGTQVTIRGRNLATASEVMFGQNPADAFTVISDRELLAVSPAGEPGTSVVVRVDSAAGVSRVHKRNSFTYDDLVDVTAPPVPAGVLATSGDGVVDLEWDAVTADDLDGYLVYVADGPSGPWTQVAAEPTTTAALTVPGLTNGSTYWFAVSSIDMTGNESDRSPAASATPAASTRGIVKHCGVLADSQTWTAQDVHVVTCTVTVPDGVTLTIAPGSIVKASPVHAFAVGVGGVLDVAGTSSDPVTVTSIRDDSVGGDTNGDGAASSPAPGDYTSAVRVPGRGASVSISHLDVRWADFGVHDDAGTGPGGDANVLSVADSTFQDIGDTALWINDISAGVEVERNVFGESGRWGLLLHGLDPSGVVLHGVDANSFVGSPGARRVVVNTEVRAGSSWTLDSTSGAVVAPTPVFSPYGGGLWVSGAVTVVPGTQIKVTGGGSSYAFAVGVGGVLDVAGTSSDPVTVTSIRDDSVGGDTNGDGAASSPAPGDYTSAVRVPGRGASVSISHLDVRWADFGVHDDAGTGPGGDANVLSVADSTFQDIGDTALWINDYTLAVDISQTTVRRAPSGLVVISGQVGFRGSILEVAHGVRACNWQSETCLVDAAHVDWGSPEGPFPLDGPLVCGAVMTSPWIGSDSGLARLFESENCDGSDTPSVEHDASRDRFNAAVAEAQIDCTGGFEDACAAMEAYLECFAAAEELAWNNVSVAGIPATPPDTGSVLSVTEEWLQTAVSPVISGAGAVLEFGRNLLGVVTLFGQLSNAYDSCA